MRIARAEGTLPGTMAEQPDKQGPHDRDRVLADTGWGVKPDDQPANTHEVAEDVARSYRYEKGTADAVRTILQLQRRAFNRPSRVVIERGRTTILDLNGDPFVIEGLSYGEPDLVALLRAVGAAFDPAAFSRLSPDHDGVREYAVSRTWAWGAERTG